MKADNEWPDHTLGYFYQIKNIWNDSTFKKTVTKLAAKPFNTEETKCLAYQTCCTRTLKSVKETTTCVQKIE